MRHKSVVLVLKSLGLIIFHGLHVCVDMTWVFFTYTRSAFIKTRGMLKIYVRERARLRRAEVYFLSFVILQWYWFIFHLKKPQPNRCPQEGYQPPNASIDLIADSAEESILRRIDRKAVLVNTIFSGFYVISIMKVPSCRVSDHRYFFICFIMHHLL